MVLRFTPNRRSGVLALITPASELAASASATAAAASAAAAAASASAADASADRSAAFFFDTKAEAEAATVPNDADGIRTLGYTSAGDGGGGLYKRVVAEPSHAGKIQSDDGAWWELAEDRVSIKQLGAIGDGSTSNTTALTNAIAVAVALAVPLFIPVGRYNYTAPLTITTNLRIEGAWVALNWGTGDDGVGINIPEGSPEITGSVLCPSSNGSNAINITGQAKTIHLSNFGISFQTEFTGTGHGINCALGDSNQGVSGSVWDTLVVWGHDGDHYAYRVENPIYCTFAHCQGYGGGLFHMFGTSATWHYGNTTMLHPHGHVIAGGTAHGISLQASTGAALNLLTIIRPQIITTNEYDYGQTLPTGAQKMFAMESNVNYLTLIAPNWETTVSSTADWEPSSGTNFIVGAVTGTERPTANFGGSIYTDLTPSSSYATLDVTSQDGITISNGASAVFCPGGTGMLAIICNTTSGSNALVFIGGGSVADVGTVSSPEFVVNDTTPAGGETGISYDGVSAYQLYNNVGSSQTYKVIVLRAA
jgi:hypothetical protein